MEAIDQSQLIRQFMLRIAPDMCEHILRTVEKEIDREYFSAGRGLGELPNEDHVKFLRDRAAQDAAYMTLRWSMHLAAQYAKCHDTLNEAKTPLETTIAAETIQREAQGSVS